MIGVDNRSLLFSLLRYFFMVFPAMCSPVNIGHISSDCMVKDSFCVNLFLSL